MQTENFTVDSKAGLRNVGREGSLCYFEMRIFQKRAVTEMLTTHWTRAEIRFGLFQIHVMRT